MSKRRRSYRGHGLSSLVKFPGMGLLPKVSSSIKPSDAVIGVAAGAVGSVAVNKGLAALSNGGTAIPPLVIAHGGSLGGLASALVLYFAQKRKNPTRASGHLVGALLGTAAVWIYQQTQPGGLAEGLGGLVRLPSGMGGQIFQNPRIGGFRGPIFANPNTNLNLGRLARMQGTGDENEDGMFPAP